MISTTLRTMRPSILPRVLVLTVLAAGLGGCSLNQGSFSPPTAAEVGPVLDNYGEAVIPDHGVIVVQGDDLVYGVSPRSRRPGLNGSTVPRTESTITETLRRVLRRAVVVNRGYPGDSARDGALRWAGEPVGNLLILSYGFGDALSKTPVNAYADALTNMVQRAHAQGAAVFLIPSPPVADPKLNAAVEPYRVALRAVGAQQDAEVFEPQAQLTLFKTPLAKGVAQTPEVYRAIAGGLVPYIRIVRPPKGKPVSARS